MVLEITHELSVCVILPAYNEALAVRESLISFAQSLPKAYIVVVDNNSTDSTQLIAEQTISEFNINAAVVSERQQGKAHAIRKALQFTLADIYVICDCDLTYPIDQTPALIETLVTSGSDMVTGDRLTLGDYQKHNTRRFHHVGNRLINFLTNLLFNSTYIDLATGLRVLSRDFINKYDINASGFEFEVDISTFAAANKLKVTEVPIRFSARQDGSQSKLNTFRDGVCYIYTIISRFFTRKLFTELR